MLYKYIRGHQTSCASLLSSTVYVHWMDLKSCFGSGQIHLLNHLSGPKTHSFEPLVSLFSHISVYICLEITFKLSDHKCWHIAIWLPFLQVLKNMNCRTQFENCPFQSLAAMWILIKLVCNIYDRMHAWENLLLMPCIYWSLGVLRI